MFPGNSAIAELYTRAGIPVPAHLLLPSKQGLERVKALKDRYEPIASQKDRLDSYP